MQGAILLYALVNILGGLIFGWAAVGINSSVGTLWRCMYDIAEDDNKNTWLITILQASVNAGAMFGALFGGYLIDTIGRKKGVAVAAAIVTAPSFASCFMRQYAGQLVSRIITGFGVGLVSSSCPPYVSEMAPKSHRGTLGSLFQVFITLGIFLANLEGYFILGEHRDLDVAPYCLTETDTSVFDNRNLIVVLPGAVFGACLFVLAVFFMKESDEWLKKQDVAGQKMLNGDMQNPSSPTGKVSLAQFPKAAVVGILMAVALQFTGINAVMFYSGNFFKAASVVQRTLASTLLMLWNFLTTLIALGLADKWGRRVLLIPNLALLSISIFLMAPIYASNISDSAKGAVCIVLLGLYILGFEVGPGALFWVVVGELFPPEVASIGFSLVNTLQWILNLAVTFLFPPLQKSMDNNVFYLFGVPGLIATALLFCWLPETGGRTKEEIVRLIRDAPWMVFKQRQYVPVGDDRS